MVARGSAMPPTSFRQQSALIVNAEQSWRESNTGLFPHTFYQLFRMQTDPHAELQQFITDMLARPGFNAQETVQRLLLLASCLRVAPEDMIDFVRIVPVAWTWNWLLTPTDRPVGDNRTHYDWLMEADSTGTQLHLRTMLSLFNYEARRRQPARLTRLQMRHAMSFYRCLNEGMQRLAQQCLWLGPNQPPPLMVNTMVDLLFGALQPNVYIGTVRAALPQLEGPPTSAAAALVAATTVAAAMAVASGEQQSQSQSQSAHQRPVSEASEQQSSPKRRRLDVTDVSGQEEEVDEGAVGVVREGGNGNGSGSGSGSSGGSGVDEGGPSQGDEPSSSSSSSSSSEGEEEDDARRTMTEVMREFRQSVTVNRRLLRALVAVGVQDATLTRSVHRLSTRVKEVGEKVKQQFPKKED